MTPPSPCSNQPPIRGALQRRKGADRGDDAGDKAWPSCEFAGSRWLSCCGKCGVEWRSDGGRPRDLAQAARAANLALLRALP